MKKVHFRPTTLSFLMFLFFIQSHHFLWSQGFSSFSNSYKHQTDISHDEFIHLFENHIIRPKDVDQDLTNEKLPNGLLDYELATLDQNTIKYLRDSDHLDHLSVKIRVDTDHPSAILDLERVDLLAEDYKKELHSSTLFFKGNVRGEPESSVALTIHQNNTIDGFISIRSEHGNHIISPLEHFSTDQYDHIIYNDKNIESYEPLGCAVSNTTVDNAHVLDNTIIAKSYEPIYINVFLDVGQDILQRAGSKELTQELIVSIFNQVATLYEKDNIHLKLSGMQIWEELEPWERNLGEYRKYRAQNPADGNYALWLNYSWDGAGGIAYLNSGCSTYNVGICQLSKSNRGTANYSYNVQIITHELGHLFGSPHTHDCAWNGNNTKIDSCGSGGIGSCPDVSNPSSSGGTIMSYCYAVSGVGVNFSNGFGPQPEALIRERLATKTCLKENIIAQGGKVICEQTTRRISFQNETSCLVQLFKKQDDGTFKKYVSVNPHKSYTYTTAIDSQWQVKNEDQNIIKEYTVDCVAQRYTVERCTQDLNLVDQDCAQGKSKKVFLRNRTDCDLNYFEVKDNHEYFATTLNHHSVKVYETTVGTRWHVKRGDVIINDFEITCENSTYAIAGEDCHIASVDYESTYTYKTVGDNFTIGLVASGQIEVKRAEPGHFDHFKIKSMGHGQVSIQGENQLYFTADGPNLDDIKCTSKTIGHNELFYLVRRDYDIYEMKSVQFMSDLSYVGMELVISDLEDHLYIEESQELDIMAEIQEHEIHLKVYPDPAVYDLNVVVSASGIIALSYSLIDVMGHTVNHVEDQRITQDHYAFDIDVRSFHPGLYFLHLDIDDKHFVKKILVHH